MSQAALLPQTALKYDAEVGDEGRVEVQVPFLPGSHVSVFIVEEPADREDELLAAAQSSLDFWDNALDDEDWNDA